MSEPLHTMTAIDLSSRMRSGELSVEAVTRHFVDRIARLDKHFTAFADWSERGAIAQARALDRERVRRPNEPRGPLWGVPTGMKDLHLTRGFHARMGSRAFRYVWSPIDDETSASVRNAGMVIVGKLTTPELAILPFIETDLHPPTRNPWAPNRTAGGSSGGSSAALAAGMLPIAAASDGAGSIRIPASFCGLVGLKPTRDLVFNPLRRFEKLGLSVIGPHARSVDDAAALMDVLLDTHNREGSFLRASRAPVRRLRVRYTHESAAVQTTDVIRDAVLEAANVLRSLGHDVEPGEGFGGTVNQFLPMFEYLVANTPLPSTRYVQPTTRWLHDRGRKVSHREASAARDSFTHRVARWFGDVDLWLTPTVGMPPPEVGSMAHLHPHEVIATAGPIGGFTAAFNASGQPAISVPMPPRKDHPPIGVQLVGRHNDDALLLALARSMMDAMQLSVAPLAREINA